MGWGRIVGLFKFGSVGIEGRMFLVKELFIIIFLLLLIFWYIFKFWIDLCFVIVIICDGLNMDFDKMDVLVVLIEWLV